MKPMCIIKAGTTFPDIRNVLGDFDDWTARGLGRPAAEIRTVEAFRNESLPSPDLLSAAVITGSHPMVTDREPWMVQISEWIRGLIDRSIPLLGICFGHQLLADAMGGLAGDHPRGREVGTVEIRLNETGVADPLLGILPPCFLGHVVHKQSALSLPPGAVLLAGNSFEPHHAFRFGDCAWGVQFHPEFDAAIMRSYVEELSPQLRAEGLPVASILAGVQETPEAGLILSRFAEIARDRNVTMLSQGGNS